MKEKKLNIFGTVYTIKEVDEIQTEEQNLIRYGETNSLTKEIVIAKSAKGINLDNRCKKLTMMHELVHAFLDECEYHDLSNNEPFVEWMAKCMTTIQEQGIFKLYE